MSDISDVSPPKEATKKKYSGAAKYKATFKDTFTTTWPFIVKGSNMTTYR